MSRFWHGFADMHTVARGEVVIREAEGVWLDRRRTAGATSTRPRPSGTATSATAAARSPPPSASSSSGCRPTRRSAPTRRSRPSRSRERLADLAPFPDAVVFLGSGGSDAVDTAAKLVRRYWDVVGKPEKRIIVSREFGYHGMHGWGTSLVGIGPMKTGYGGNFIDEVVNVGTMDVETLGALFAERAHEIAAFIGEPVVGAGGVIPPEPHYWPEVTRLCREHDILLIADEVITGFGRTGKLWGSQRYGIEPDLITFAKGVTSGLPAARRRAGRASGSGRRSGTTTCPAPCSATATPTPATRARPPRRWPTSTSSRARSWSRGWPRWSPCWMPRSGGSRRRPGVGEIRTVGLTAAVAFQPDLLAADPGLPERVGGRGPDTTASPRASSAATPSRSPRRS